MSLRTLTRRQVRELDRRAIEEYGVPSVVLMENAGRGVVDILCKLGAIGPVSICCGKGNNAGDGFVIARHLDLRGIPLKVLLWAQPNELRGDAATNYRIIERSRVPLVVFGSQSDRQRLQVELIDSQWIIDALLGTGARGEPRPPLDEVIDQLNAHPAPTLAVDLPSGLDCDTGQPSTHTIRAAHTCTFVAAKPGFLMPSAQSYLGQLHVIDIGAPRPLLEEMLGE